MTLPSARSHPCPIIFTFHRLEIDPVGLNEQKAAIKTIWFEHHRYYPQGHHHHSCRFFSGMQFIVFIWSNASSHDRRIKYNTKMFTTCWEPIIQMMLQSWIKLSDINMSPCLYTMCTPQQQCDLTKVWGVTELKAQEWRLHRRVILCSHNRTIAELKHNRTKEHRHRWEEHGTGR